MPVLVAQPAPRRPPGTAGVQELPSRAGLQGVLDLGPWLPGGQVRLLVTVLETGSRGTGSGLHCEVSLRDASLRPARAPSEHLRGRGGAVTEGPPSWPPSEPSAPLLHGARRNFRLTFPEPGFLHGPPGFRPDPLPSLPIITVTASVPCSLRAGHCSGRGTHPCRDT